MKPESEQNQADIWDNIWSSDKSGEDFEYWFNRDIKSARTQGVLNYLKRYFSNLKGLKIIELGSGMGVYSLIMAKLGAEPILFDKSHVALDKAKERFKKENINIIPMHGDIFSIKKDLFEKFDIAMSFGTVEHFLGEGRFSAIKAHLDLIKPGGIIIVSVPNILFLPHEILKRYLVLRKKWQIGHEYSFSRFELLNIGKKLNLKNMQIVGSSFAADFKRYIRLYRNTNMASRIFGRYEEKSISLEERPGIFDNIFGADIVLLGRKQ